MPNKTTKQRWKYNIRGIWYERRVSRLRISWFQQEPGQRWTKVRGSGLIAKLEVHHHAQQA